MTALTSLINRFSSYLTVGLANTLICLGLMYLGDRLGFDYLQYTAFGYLMTITFSFFLNLHFTFRVKGLLLRRLALFLLVSLVNLGLVECFEYLLIEHADVPRILAVLCAMTWYVVTGFLASNFWIYRATAESGA